MNRSLMFKYKVLKTLQLDSDSLLPVVCPEREQRKKGGVFYYGVAVIKRYGVGV